MVNFFRKSDTVSNNSLLAKVQPIKNQINAKTYQELVQQVNTIECNLNYFKKKYPDLNARINQFEAGYIQAINNISNANTRFNYPDELKEVLHELKSLVSANKQNHDNLVMLTIFSFGTGVLVGFGGLDALLTGIALAATGHVGALICGAILLTLSVCLIALAIGVAVEIVSKTLEANKYEELETIINQPLNFNLATESSDKVESDSKMADEEYTEDTHFGYSH